MKMKIDLPIWIKALRKEFHHSQFVEEVVVYLNSHLPCTNCGEVKLDEEFHKGSSPARRFRYPICKDCTSQTRNKKQDGVDGGKDAPTDDYEKEAMEE